MAERQGTDLAGELVETQIDGKRTVRWGAVSEGIVNGDKDEIWPNNHIVMLGQPTVRESWPNNHSVTIPSLNLPVALETGYRCAGGKRDRVVVLGDLC